MRDHSPVELVLLVTTALLLAPVVGTVVVSAAPVENDTYAVAQGTDCTVVDPVVDDSQNATEFYDYRNPNPNITGNPASGTFSSFGTTEYQETHTSTFFFYEGSEGASLVVVNGELGDEAGGSTLTMTFNGLPADGEWVVEDDEYQGRDDDWDISETSTTVDWLWGDNRTDGGVYSGVGNHSGTITVTPAFNEEAAAWGDWGYSGSDEYRMESWRVLGADGTEVELDRDRKLFIHGGGCEETPPSAALTGPNNAETGEDVTLDAGETTDDGTIGGYEWDLDGDGETDRVTTDATLDHAFDESGEHTVAVTAFDTYGNGDTAELAVNVTQPAAPPEAALSAPDEVTVNDTFTLDASASTADGTNTSYEWDLDGDGEVEQTTNDSTFDHSYNETGPVEPIVTVVDEDGERDSASTEIDVLGPNQPPNASLDAPETVDEGDTVTLDAANSTDDRGIESYRWTVSGEGEFVGDAEGPTVDYTFDEPGNVTAEVVVDDGSATDSANATIRVRDVDNPPTAILNAPEEATVNETITLDASDSTDDEGIERYEWDLDGDGEVDNVTEDATIQHAYGEPGTFDATVTVNDTVNQTNAAEATITVAESNEPNESLSVTLDAPETATVNGSVSLNAVVSGNDEEDSEIERYEWDLDGDGEVDNVTQDPTIEHAFPDAGPVTVSVTAFGGDDDNVTANASTTVIVGDPAAANTSIVVATDEPTVGEPVSFEAAVTTATEVTSYAWQFGDGATGSGASAQHTYGDAGSYEVTLELTTAGGVSTTTTTTVSVAEADTGNGGNDGGGSGDGGDSNDSNDSNDNNDNDNGNNAGGGQQSGGQQGGGQQGDSQDATPEPEAEIGQANVSFATERLLTGETLVVEATVENSGGATGTKTVEFEVEGEILEERVLTLAPGETRTVTFEHEFDSAGEKAVEVDHGRTRTVVVEAREPNLTVSALEVDQRQVDAGEEFTLTATVANNGTAAGERAVALELFGEQVATQNVSVPVGEAAEISFTRSVIAPGSYEATVGNESVTVEVVGTETTAQSDPATDTEAPGFGAVTAALALLGLVLTLRRLD